MPTFDNATTTPNRNAVRHGLTAEQPLNLDESRRLAELTAMWARKLGVADMAERLVAHRIAVSILKLERCEAADRAVVGPNVEAALRDWERERRHAVRRRAQELADDPAGTVRTLRGSAFGCDWLIRKWRQLRALLADGRGWSGTGLALSLMGRRPGSAPADDPHVAALLAGADALLAGADATAPEIVALGDLIDRIIADLEQHRAIGWENVEGPERESVIANARVDSSPEGRLRHRYEQDAERAMSRNLDFLRKLRQVERPPAVRQAPAPASVAESRPPAPRPDAAAAGAPSEAHPSRNEARSAARSSGDSSLNTMKEKELGEVPPAEQISILRRTEAAPDGAPGARGRTGGVCRRTGPPPALLRAGQAGPSPPPARLIRPPDGGPRSFSIRTPATVPDRGDRGTRGPGPPGASRWPGRPGTESHGRAPWRRRLRHSHPNISDPSDPGRSPAAGWLWRSRRRHGRRAGRRGVADSVTATQTSMIRATRDQPSTSSSISGDRLSRDKRRAEARPTRSDRSTRDRPGSRLTVQTCRVYSRS